MRMTLRLTSAAIAAVAALVSHTASAQTEDTAVNRAGGSVGAVAGVLIRTCSGCGAAFAFGAEGGYTFPMHLFVGGQISYAAGTLNSWMFEPEVGYDLALFGDLPIMLRPYIGIGYENVSYGGGTGNASCAGSPDLQLCQAELAAVGGVSASVGSFVISPGVLGTYAITPHIYAGANLRLDILTASGAGEQIAILGTGGYRF